LKVTLIVTGPLKKSHPGPSSFDVEAGCTLIQFLSENADDLLDGSSLRGDLLYLINGMDAEVRGGATAELQDGDSITVVPIAHGGRSLEVKHFLFKDLSSYLGLGPQ